MKKNCDYDSGGTAMSQLKLNLLKMKLTFLCLILGVFQLMASQGFSQSTRLTLNLKDVKVEDVLMQIEEQTDYYFIYNREVVDVSRKVNVTCDSKDVSEILSDIFKNKNVIYEIQDRHIILKSSVNSSEQKITVTGKVTDSLGAPLPGVTVVLKGTNNGTITNFDGLYTLSDIPVNGIIQFSFVGMKMKELSVSGQTSINVKMEEDAIGLDEVVAIGYGTQKRVNLTGSVSTVKAEVMESRPVKNAVQALQGLVPGLNFVQSGTVGDLDETLDINIRGTGTIGSGSVATPLVLIDGVQGDINAINPQDIDNISVLKDASASSIYGSRAAFGVVLITTKTGNREKMTVNYNNNFNMSMPLALPDQLDSYSFALYWNEGSYNDGGTALFTNEILDRIQKYQAGELDQGTYEFTGQKWEFYLKGNGNTDWIDVHFKDFTTSQEHNLSVSGGTEKSKYFLSGNYLDQNGILEYSGDNLKRYSMSMNITTELSKKVKFKFINRFVRTDYSEATHQGSMYYWNIYRKYPVIPLYDPNGYLSRASEVPQIQQGGRKKFQTDNHYVQGKLTFTPLKGWNINAEGNFRIISKNNSRNVLPAYCHLTDGTPYLEFIAYEGGYLTAGYTEAYEYNQKNHFYTTNIYSDYEFSINDKHNFKVLGGFNAELYKTRSFSAKKTDLISKDFPVLDLAIGDDLAKGTYGHWSTAGFFGRLNYNFNERYLFEVNLRYDGSSRFLDDQRWNLFPSASVGWNVAKERFWNFSSISSFKFRGSYGELGNQNTSNWYPFYASMPISTQAGGWLIGGEKPNIASDPGLISKNLTWERIKSWNIGFDMTALRNRLNFSFDYFNRITFDMVGPAPELPVILGTAVPKMNNAKMKSAGFELETSWRDKIDDFKYGVRLILSDDQQSILDYPNDTYSLSTWFNGKKLNDIWGYTTIGIAKTQEEMDAHLANVSQNRLGSNWSAGDIMYADLNNDGKIDGGAGTLNDSGDRKVIGNYTPRYKFGLDLTGSWKNFDFRLFFQGVGKRDFATSSVLFWGIGASNIWTSLGMTHHLDYFRDENSVMVQAGHMPANLDSYYPKPYFYTSKNRQLQTRYLLNAAYMRLKNMQIGYTIPKHITGKVGISKVRFFLTGENLLTLTKLPKYMDPEMITPGTSSQNYVGYPIQKVYAIGVNVNF